jgi:hypothetical protein
MALCVSRLRVLLIGTLIISLHSSVCTGGIFSVSAAFAGRIGTNDATAVLFSEDTLLCQLFTPVAEGDVQSAVAAASHGSGCQDSDFCFQNAVRGSREDIPLVLGSDDAPSLPAILPEEAVVYEGRVQYLLAQDGPRFHAAPLLAHVLIKRE